MESETPIAGAPEPSSFASLVGAQDDRWSLARAIDALGASARQVGAPGAIWLAGLVYPTLSLGFANLFELGLRYDETGGHLQARLLGEFSRPEDYWALIPIALVLPVLMRFVSGLARISTPQVWVELTRTRRAPRLRDAWAAGRGHAFAALALWIQLVLMVAVAAVALLVPPFFFLRGTGLEETSIPFLLLLGPFVGVWLIYGLLVSVIYQLALHSLAQNHRGVASALIHGWRIARHDPWATARAVLVDFLLYVTMMFLTFALSMILLITCIGPVLVWLLLPGFTGLARAAYWARAYRALGGLSPDDRVPGLVPPPPR